MASLSTRGKAHSVQYFDAYGKRRTIYLGMIRTGAANAIREHIEYILSANASRQAIPADTAKWIGDMPAKLRNKLARFGLVQVRKVDAPVALGFFLASYIGGRTDLKPRTIANLEQARNQLVSFFGKHRDIRTINFGEAGDWFRSMKGAQATIATHVKKARQFFADAIDRKLIAENPFSKIKIGSQANDDNGEYIPAGVVEQMLARCPSIEWQALFILARHAGLRTPSETSLLRWSDMDFEAGRMTFRSPKTAHHPGGAKRTIPLFPRVRRILLDVLEQAADGEVYVLPTLRRENLRRMTGKIIDRAGLTVWPRPFQNLRASCETDLTARFPLHVVCKWIGNTQAVAQKHYLKVTDEHFAMAIEESAAKSAAETTGNPRTFTGRKMQNPQKIEDFGPILYPQGESNPAVVSTEKVKISRKALRKALHRVKRVSSSAHQLERRRLRSLMPRRASTGGNR